MNIDGQAAIVTGAGSGMGEATARMLAAAGARVGLLDVNEDGARAVADEIGGIAVRCDVADAGSAEAAIATLREAHGPARICVSCAGIGPAGRVVGRDGPMPLDDFRRVIEINLIGTFNISRLACADMAETAPMAPSGERGVVVFTASVAAFEGQIGQAAYSASKGGVIAMMLPMAREMARHGVRIMTIAPGLVATPMLAGLPPEVQASLAAQVPFPPRLGRPEEFASLVRTIVEHEMLNAETIRMDGAIRMAPK